MLASIPVQSAVQPGWHWRTGSGYGSRNEGWGFRVLSLGLELRVWGLEFRDTGLLLRAWGAKSSPVLYALGGHPTL